MTCFVIAEGGVNHNGSEELALQLVEAAAEAGADAVKFQSFKTESLVSRNAPTAEYQKEQTGSDNQYGMLKKLELTENAYSSLADHSKEFGIEFLSTPFDIDSAQQLIQLGMNRIKVPSGELTNHPFIRQLTAFNLPMIISTGMATMEEVEETVNVIKKERKRLHYLEKLDNVITLLHCTSNYPPKDEDVNLAAMQTMAEHLGLPVGYSDHTRGTLVSVAAVAMGATVIEKHFTLDKSLPGPDHKASLTPNELHTMIKQIRRIEKCFGDGEKKPSDSELPIRELVRRSVTLVSDKKAGEILTEVDIALLRPGTGIPPKDYEKVFGRQLKKSHNAGTTLKWQDLV